MEAPIFFQPEHVPTSSIKADWEARPAGSWAMQASRGSVRQSAEDAPRHTHPHPQPYPANKDGGERDHDLPPSLGGSVLGGSAMEDFDFDEASALRSKSACASHGVQRKSRNYGSAARIGALLEHANAVRSHGFSAGPPCPTASSSVLSRPAYNSSVSRQQRVWDAAASTRLPDEEVEKRVRQEMKRIEASGKHDVSLGRTDTLEALMAIEGTIISNHLHTNALTHTRARAHTYAHTHTCPIVFVFHANTTAHFQFSLLQHSSLHAPPLSPRALLPFARLPHQRWNASRWELSPKVRLLSNLLREMTQALTDKIFVIHLHIHFMKHTVFTFHVAYYIKILYDLLRIHFIFHTHFMLHVHFINTHISSPYPFLADAEIFSNLVPLQKDVKHVLKAKIVKKQIDPKWQAMLALKPSMALFDDEAPDRYFFFQCMQ